MFAAVSKFNEDFKNGGLDGCLPLPLPQNRPPQQTQQAVSSIYNPSQVLYKDNPPPNAICVGRYFFHLKEGGREFRSTCVDTLSGERRTVQVYDKKEFVHLAHILLAPCPGVNSPLDVLSVDEKALIVSRKTYGDLHDFVRSKKKLSESCAAPLFKQIAGLVKEAHSRGIVLRDVKLKKFVFSDSERTSLLLQNLEDARFGDTLTDRHGCPAYISPEMLLPGSYSGKSADMWSLGVILYCLLVGYYPFFERSPQALFVRIRSGYFHIPDHVSFLARSVIGSLLSYEPERRPTAEQILEHPWFSKPLDDLEMMSDQLVPQEKIDADF